MIQIKILSDPICPWCYIGKTGLEKAMKQFSPEFVKIVWEPFQLNPQMPEEGMERKAYLLNKFGSSDHAIKAYAPILEHFKILRIHSNLEKIKTTPNTLNSQRLIYWAGIEGCQLKLVDNIFQGYFLNGADIGDKGTLIKLGEMSGLPEKLTKKLLASDEDRETILSIEAKYRNAGVKGVPTFLVNDYFVVPGAQTEAFWTKVLNEISEKLLKA